MSSYEIVALIRAMVLYESSWIPFEVVVTGTGYRLLCVAQYGNDRCWFDFPREWLESMVSRRIKYSNRFYSLFTGVDDVRKKHKALRS